MANKTIPELTLAPSIATTHVIPVDNGTQTFKATVAQLAEAFADATRNRGVPVWNAAATYAVGAVVADGAQTGYLFVSLAGSNTNHALTDAAYWRKVHKAVTAAKTASFTIGADYWDAVIPINTTAGVVSVTLPVGGLPKHASFTIKDIAGTFQTNVVTIVRAGSESIEGVAANFVCNKKFGVYTFISDGTNVYLINQGPSIDTASKAETLGSKAVTSNQVIIPNHSFITSDTSDGADTRTMCLSGGGGGSAWTQNRGAGIILNGNEVSGAEGEMVYYAGNSGGSFGRHRWVAAGVNVGNCGQDKVWTLGDGSLAASQSVLQLLKANATSNRLIAGIDAATRGYVRINGAQTNLEFEGASDRRIKENIAPLEGSLEKILALNPCTFKMKDTGNDDVNFIAQEFIKVFPEMVTTTDSGEGEELPEGIEPWTLSTGSLPVHLVKALQEQQKIIDALMKRIIDLENK